jgi:hypothetical protein
MTPEEYLAGQSCCNDQEHPEERPHQGDLKLGIAWGLSIAVAMWLAFGWFLYRAVTGEGL